MYDVIPDVGVMTNANGHTIQLTSPTSCTFAHNFQLPNVFSFVLQYALCKSKIHSYIFYVVEGRVQVPESDSRCGMSETCCLWTGS